MPTSSSWAAWGSNRSAAACCEKFFVLQTCIKGNPVEAVDIFVKEIERKFISDYHQDNQANAHANGKADDVNEGVGFLAKEVSDSKQKVIF